MKRAKMFKESKPLQYYSDVSGAQETIQLKANSAQAQGPTLI